MTFDYAKRHAVLRAYIEGRDWDGNEEFALVRRLVMSGDPQLADVPLLFDYEWEVVAGLSNLGCGDLVFTDGDGRFAVVEVKFIDDTRTGHTVRVKRTKSRKQVREQALTYAGNLRDRLGPSAVSVRGYAYTNQGGLVPADEPVFDEAE